jgi:tetratricopeptide (TPR) repeat protein
MPVEIEIINMRKVIPILLLIAVLAINSFGQIIETEKSLLLEGYVLLQKGEMEKAALRLDKVISINPKNFSAFFLRGNVRFIRHDLQGAVDDFTKVIEIAPNAKDIDKVYNFRGSAFYLLENKARAILDYDEAISLNPNNPDPYVGRANALYDRGEIIKSAADYDKAIQLNQKETAAYVGRADIRFYLREYELALEDLNKSLDLTPNIASCHLKRGAVYGLLGKWQLAIIDISKAADLSAASTSPYWGNVKVSLADIDKFVKKNPLNAKAFAVRGFIFLFRGMDDKSDQDFKVSFNLDLSLKNELQNLILSVKQTRKQ